MNTPSQGLPPTTLYYRFALADAFIVDSRGHVNGDVGPAPLQRCWEKGGGRSFFQPCSRFVRPAAVTAVRLVSGSLWVHRLFPLLPLQEKLENCNLNNANGATPDLSCWFNHTKCSSGLITTHTARVLLFNDLGCEAGHCGLCLGKNQAKYLARRREFPPQTQHIHLVISGRSRGRRGLFF